MPKFVDHSYQDFSRYIEEGGKLCKHKKSGNNFPARLHRILSDSKHSHLITWMPHGRAWRIIDRERFVREIIPKYFSSSKYHSFCRQLNWWGFKRLCGPGPDLGCYYHQCFLRDLPQLTCLIRRTTTSEGRLKPNIDSEPNLYMISKERPLRAKAYPPLLLPLNSEQVAPFSSEDNKTRVISLDDLPDIPALVQHVVSTSSLLPENNPAHEFSAPQAPSRDSLEEMTVAPWETSFFSSNQGQHDGPYHYPSGFISQQSPLPLPHHILPTFATVQQRNWISHEQSDRIHYHVEATEVSDNGTVHHRDSMVKNDHGWKQQLTPEPSSGIIDDGFSVHHLQDDELLHSSYHYFNDPYAPLPVEGVHHDHLHLHDERCLEGWIDGCLSVLNVEK